MAFALSFISVLLSISLSRAYVWPNEKMDELEALRWDQAGFNAGALSKDLSPCDRFLFGSNKGRSNAADWIRTAYHDMATHNSEDGTGGLDASIRFQEEQSRGENSGDGFRNTLLVVSTEATPRVSVADVIAAGMIIAVEHCGGPEINYRGGRVDATQPNAPGVPEPQGDINSHVASFARQGFNHTEMIGLVACGHSFGGVQHVVFPDIVPELNDANNTESNAPFDSTPVTFDNKVATEYIDGSTKNPLVVGLNDTMNSDKRIFEVDGNATMRAFANSEALFASTCADLFARMIDTVPREVQLTEVIKPLPVKPYNFVLKYLGDGKLQFSGMIRVWDAKENPNRKVTMTWANSDGTTSDANTAVLAHTPNMVGSAMGGRVSSVYYKLDSPEAPSFVTLDAAKSISKISFTIDEGDGSAPRVEDQAGRGFVMQDTVMWANSSCTSSTAQSASGRLGIAIRRGVTPTRVFLERTNQAADRTDAPFVTEIDVPAPSAAPGDDAPFVIWSITLDDSNANVPYRAGAEVDGVRLVTADLNGLFLPNMPACASAAR